MKLKVFSVRDMKAQIWNTPFFQKTTGEAERSFQSLANDQQTMVAKYPEDYSLYMLGEWDDDLGVLIPLDAPIHMLTATAVSRRHLETDSIRAVPTASTQQLEN